MQNKEPSALYSIEQHLERSGVVLQMTGRERIPEYGEHNAKATMIMLRICTFTPSTPIRPGPAHHRSGQEAAEEIRSRAQRYSMEAAEKTNAIARQTPEPARV
jgi:hypothetical protein